MKVGSNYTGFYATTVTTPGTSDWHSYGSLYYSGLLVSPYLGGLGVTSANTGALATAVFDNVTP